MSQDIVADCLNQIMNAKIAGRQEIEVTRISKLLVNVLEIMKKYGYIDFKEGKGKIVIKIKEELSECRAIKPRYNVKKEEVEKYIRRFLPARNLGILIISTNKGLVTQEESEDKGTGGSLIAYVF